MTLLDITDCVDHGVRSRARDNCLKFTPNNNVVIWDAKHGVAVTAYRAAQGPRQ
jgi:hypothetical protein